MDFVGKEIGRKMYFAIGFGLVILKYNIDRIVSMIIANQPVSIFDHWNAMISFDFQHLTDQHRTFLLIMFLTSIPFIFVGVLLTVGRLKDAGLPRWMSGLFFLPFVNVLFFLLLCLLPAQRNNGSLAERPPGFLAKFLPQGKWGSAIVSSFMSSLIGVGMIYLSTEKIDSYGGVLFIVLPFMMGMGAALLHGYHERRSSRQSISVACLSITCVGILLLGFALEGVICLVLAAPVAYFTATLGGLVGHVIQMHYWDQRAKEKLFCQLFVLFPLLLMMENRFQGELPTYPVTSCIQIKASPEEIWPQIIQFQKIEPPTEWIFKTGVAYPVEARINGKGVGAVRHCVFSTGSFVEPITVWNPPLHLAFSVIEQPSPMDELSPYHSIAPPHLHGFFESERGEFRLEKVSDGTTNVYGTTWYHHDLWPQFYWQPWTNWFIHKIHLRVLNHIKNCVETGSQL